MNASEIIGKEVFDKDVHRIGKLADIGLNVERGTIDYFIIKMGLTKKAQITNNEIALAGDKIILNITREELEKSPVDVKK